MGTEHDHGIVKIIVFGLIFNLSCNIAHNSLLKISYLCMKFF